MTGGARKAEEHCRRPGKKRKTARTRGFTAGSWEENGVRQSAVNGVIQATAVRATRYWLGKGDLKGRIE